ncbi:hypothetical protein [Acinetobacter courvalinii]|uniref:hypothetical protein n=1 Tax=Acinetobacter courvalinii TaxID=280147 RepID=UPI0021D1435B|nr:hypothetical protein [Acinetobacter courvalinii]MCU4367528.1 hypothetical protein [Acinetobacter courvalinii]MCU4445734.1 hypothetical protein [Acinetobacter courvalinii]MCU4639337.1 hypothetical protein [Acinetobacter courvalinii]
MIKYIPDLDQEEETLITAKVDAALERLKKRMKVNRIVYLDKELKISLTFKVESHLRS